MGIHRAFTDIHHEATEPAYNAGDFQLIVNDGSGNPIWNPGIDETVFTDFSANGDGTGGMGDPTGTGIFPGFASRTYSIIETNDNELDLFGGGNPVSSRRLTAVYMGNNTDSQAFSKGDLVPDGALIDPINSKFLRIGYNQLQSIDNNGNEFFMIGSIFTNADGFPQSVTINTIDYIGFGLFLDTRASIRPDLGLLKPITYPTDPDNNKVFSFDLVIEPAGVDGEKQYVIDKTSKLLISVDINNNVTGTVDLSNNQSVLDALFNNKYIPAIYGMNNFNAGGASRIDDFRIGVT